MKTSILLVTSLLHINSHSPESVCSLLDIANTDLAPINPVDTDIINVLAASAEFTCEPLMLGREAVLHIERHDSIVTPSKVPPQALAQVTATAYKSLLCQHSAAELLKGEVGRNAIAYFTLLNELSGAHAAHINRLTALTGA